MDFFKGIVWSLCIGGSTAIWAVGVWALVA